MVWHEAHRDRLLRLLPRPDSPASCYLLEAEDEAGRAWRVLLELGNGALGALHNYIDPLTVDGVLVSHLHPDHCLDLCGYYVMRKYHPQGPQPRIPVWGPAGTADRMARAYDLPLDPGMREEFDFREYDGKFDLGPFTVEPIEVDHPVRRLRAADHRRRRDVRLQRRHRRRARAWTGWRPTYRCCSRRRRSGRRRQPAPPAPHRHRLRRRSPTRGGVGRLVVTHVPPWHDKEVALAEAAAAYDGDVELARPGAVYEF